MDDYKILEARGQTTLFDFIKPEPKQCVQAPIAPVQAVEVGQRVKVLTLDEILDRETRDYLKYYFPHCLKKEGIVSAVKGTYCTVKFGSDYVYLYFDEVEVLE